MALPTLPAVINHGMCLNTDVVSNTVLPHGGVAKRLLPWMLRMAGAVRRKAANRLCVAIIGFNTNKTRMRFCPEGETSEPVYHCPSAARAVPT